MSEIEAAKPPPEAEAKLDPIDQKAYPTEHIDEKNASTELPSEGKYEEEAYNLNV